MPRTFNGQELYITQQTRDNFWTSHPIETTTADPSGQQIAWWRCVSCDNWGTYDGLQIGHRTEWELYLQQQGITAANSFEEALACFNDMVNLGPQHTTCNTGHEWEYRNFLGEPDEMDLEDADAHGNLAGFVTYQCPNCHGEDTRDTQNPNEYQCDTCQYVWVEQGS